MNRKLYYNGQILTMDDRYHSPEAVLTENGRIMALGRTEELKTIGRDAEQVDLAGAAMLPGFIDGHSHLTAAAYQLLMVNVNPSPTGRCNSVEELVEEGIRALAQTHLEDGQWFMGMGYDNSVYPDGKHPTREDLDKISRDIPVSMMHVSGHLCVVNTKAMELLGYGGSGYEVPEGGVVQPDGLLKEQAFLAPHKQKLMQGPGPDQVLKAVGRASRLYASYGITTAQDGRTTRSDYELLKAAGAAGLLKNDVISYMAVDCAKEFLPRQYPALNGYMNHYRPAGCKIYLDGSPQGKTAWLSQPYLVPPDGQNEEYRGFPVMESEDVFQVMETCIRNHWQINVHANGDEAIEQMIRCYTKALKAVEHPEKLRPVVIHCQTVREDQLDRLKGIGMLPSFFLDHVYYWGDYHFESVLGPERAERISPAASAVKRSMSFTLHQDSPVVPPNILFSIHNAVNRKTKNGMVLGEEQRVPVIEALKAATVYAAYQIFEEENKGSITPGKLADFVILDQNPLKADKETLKDIKVLRTIKEGEDIL